MGDKKGKKDKAKKHRQSEARHAKAEKEESDGQQRLTMGNTQVRGVSHPRRGQK